MMWLQEAEVISDALGILCRRGFLMSLQAWHHRDAHVLVRGSSLLLALQVYVSLYALDMPSTVWRCQCCEVT